MNPSQIILRKKINHVKKKIIIRIAKLFRTTVLLMILNKEINILLEDKKAIQKTVQLLVSLHQALLISDNEHLI
jgi:hypothetical protein